MARAAALLGDYYELTKPTLVLMALVTTALGYFLAHGELMLSLNFGLTMVATACTYGGAAVLNHYLERDRDGLMVRTQERPLVQGSISAKGALAFGALLTALGIVLMKQYVGNLASLLLLFTAVLYVLIYTPMKTRSWLNTLVGSIPGAMPPVIGWVAAQGMLDYQAVIPFLILFAWQQPHFYAIAWMHRDDYKRGGFKMLPVVEPSGKWTFRQVLFFTLFLIYVSVLPGLWGYHGVVYIIGVFILGAGLFYYSVDFVSTKTEASARRLMRASLFYLPLLFLLILID